MGKARSFRLTKENEIRFEQLKDMLKLDNHNQVFNRVIEDYHSFKKHERVLEAFKVIMEELGR